MFSSSPGGSSVPVTSRVTAVFPLPMAPRRGRDIQRTDVQRKDPAGNHNQHTDGPTKRTLEVFDFRGPSTASKRHVTEDRQRNSQAQPGKNGTEPVQPLPQPLVMAAVRHELSEEDYHSCSGRATSIGSKAGSSSPSASSTSIPRSPAASRSSARARSGTHSPSTTTTRVASPGSTKWPLRAGNGSSGARHPGSGSATAGRSPRTAPRSPAPGKPPPTGGSGSTTST
jgi:hypothetical protein